MYEKKVAMTQQKMFPAYNLKFVKMEFFSQIGSVCPFFEHISLLYQTPSETEETKRREPRTWTPLADRNRQLAIAHLERDDVEQPGGEN